MGIDRSALVSWYHTNRERSRSLFRLLTDDAFYSRPISLRHPIVFYAGHLPAFSFNTLVKRGLGGPPIDAHLETLFARGIDPPLESGSDADFDPTRGAASLPGQLAADPTDGWPSREEVDQFAAEADRRVLEVLEREDLDRPGHPLLDRGDAVFTILEHEAMHQETLLYMWHRLPFDQKRRPAEYAPRVAAAPAAAEWIRVPAGSATLGVNRDQVPFGWDNELPSLVVDVGSFEIERHNVTNAQFLEFVNDRGYDNERWWSHTDWQWIHQNRIRYPLFWELDDSTQDARRERPREREWYWRGMFDRLPLPLSWPVFVSQAEATAYARWRGARLATEAEYQRAAYGSTDGERRHPWGDEPPSARHGVFDFSSWDPEAAGAHPAGASAWGIEDLVGNGWEWTATTFTPFPGFRAGPSYPEYSADFFDAEHYVMKGASPVTARELIRPTFRNWFRPHYPYVYATFRCVKNLD